MSALIFKYGTRDFSRNLGFNIFIIIQITLVFIACIFTSSSVSQNLKYYNAFADILDGEGYCASPFVDGSSRVIFSTDIEDNKQFSDYGDYFEDVVAIHQIIAIGENGAENPYPQRTFAYNGCLIDNYKPMINNGKWLSDVKSESNILHAVISPNNYGLKVGDTIKQEFYTESGSVCLDVKIVGMMKNGAKLFGATSDNDEISADSESTDKMTIEMLFSNYYSDVAGKPAFVYNLDELEQYGISYITEQRMLIPFRDNLTEDEISQAKEALDNFTIGAIPFTQIKKDTFSEIRKQLIILIPIIIGLLILIIVSILSFTAITTHKRLKNYGVLYLCGGCWKQCAFINFTVIVIDLILSAFLTCFVIQSMKLIGLLDNTVVMFTLNECLICLGISVIIMIVSLIMPLVIIGGTQPKEILKTDD